MLSFFERYKKVHAMLMRGIAINIDLETGFFEDYVTIRDNTLQLLHYFFVAFEGF